MISLKYLNKYLFKYRFRLLIGVSFVIAANIFSVLPAQIIRVMFDLVKENVMIYGLFNGFVLQKTFYELFTLCILFFAFTVILFAIVRGFFLFFMRQTIIVVSRYIEYDLKNEIYDHYQKLPSSFYKKYNTGDLMARISEDVVRVRMYLGPAIMYSLNVIVLFVLVISTMLSVNARLTLYVLTPMPFLILAIYWTCIIINKKSEQIQSQLSYLSTYVQEAFSGIRIIKSYVKEANLIVDFDKESELYKQKSLELSKVQAIFFPFIILLIGLSTILTIYIGGLEVIAGSITTGNIAEFVVYVNLLTWPVASIGWITSLIQRAAASQARINELLMLNPELEMDVYVKPQKNIISYENEIFKEIKGEIKFNNVSFTYKETGIYALKNINLEINEGESLAVIGRTGSGKSTLAGLIVRTIMPDSGEILIDNSKIQNFNLGHLRKSIGYVPQDVFLFSDTIENNIAFGTSMIENEKQGEQLISDTESGLILKAAQDASIYDDIMLFPDGFKTRIGERGITLSGGQKQRLSIARAIIKAPKILLFDDCLSAVDTYTEEKILNNLKKVMNNRTTIIIGHRISTVKHADKIIVLDNGKIIERGTHESLLEKQGAYYQLYKKQLIEESLMNV